MLKEVFDFGMHDSKIVETFYDHHLHPVTVPVNCVVDLSTIRPFYRRQFRVISNFLAEADKRGERSFYIRRTFALGDILMLVPVIRYLRTLGYDPYVKTTDLFKDVLDMLGVRVLLVRDRANTEDFGIALDGTIERDHWEKELNQIHRVYIYLRSLGVKEIPEKLDWDCDLSQLPEIDVGDDPYVVLQDGGSTRMKQLQGGTKYIKEKLKGAGVRVVCISDLFGKHLKSSLHLFSLMAKAKCAITMDSGPLWVSHFTKTPVVCIFGPTRPKERLTLHPLYPEGASAIELSKEVDCEPCFEHAVKCNGTVSCLGVPVKRVYELIEPEVMRFWKD